MPRLGKLNNASREEIGTTVQVPPWDTWPQEILNVRELGTFQGDSKYEGPEAWDWVKDLLVTT